MSKLTLTPEVTQRLRRILQDCDFLATDQQLKTLFADGRLTPWKDSLTQADTVASRIEVIINLQNRFSADSKNALILCLQVLQEHIHSGDGLHHQLGQIIQEITPVTPVRSPMARRATASPVSQVQHSDRRHERHLFEGMLRRTHSWRGLLLHSNGQGGLGKSTLLQMYERECHQNGLPYPTVYVYLDARRLMDWRTILDRSVEKLGADAFNQYLRLRATYETRARGYEGSSSKQMVMTASPDLKGGGEVQNSSAENESSLAELRQQLTYLFLADLASLELQLVWLVDTAEKLDGETQEWLRYMFDQLVDDKVDNLIMVVAGRHPWPYEPSWERRVGQREVTHFSQDVIEEILQELHPTIDMTLCKMIANLLMDKSKGQPLEIFTFLQAYLPYGRLT